MDRHDVQTASELLVWALAVPPDMSRGSGSESERFAAVLPHVVCQVEYIHRKVEGTGVSAGQRRHHWWVLDGDAKRADVFERAIQQVKYERSGRAGRASEEEEDDRWREVLRIAIERASLSPTRGKGMVRDALRASHVRHVAVAAGLKVSRGRESPPYRTACDAVALAELVWKRGHEADTHERRVAAIMLELLTCTRGLSATLEIASLARKEAERMVTLDLTGLAKEEAERVVGREFGTGLGRLEACLAEHSESASPLPSAANILQIWNRGDRVSRASATDAELAVRLLWIYRTSLPQEVGISDAVWEAAIQRLERIRKASDADEAKMLRPWHAATVEKGGERQDSPP